MCWIHLKSGMICSFSVKYKRRGIITYIAEGVGVGVLGELAGVWRRKDKGWSCFLEKGQEIFWGKAEELQGILKEPVKCAVDN